MRLEIRSYPFEVLLFSQVPSTANSEHAAAQCQVEFASNKKKNYNQIILV